MNIYFIRKRIGNRKELGRHPFTLDEAPSTLRQLLTVFTLHGLREAQTVVGDLPLTEEEIAAQGCGGAREIRRSLWSKQRHTGSCPSSDASGLWRWFGAHLRR